jgi:hypothetical protein
MKKIEQLKKKYESACQEYVDMFCEKQEMEFIGWVGNEVGGIVTVSDFYFNFSDIVLDINTEQPKNAIIDWYYDNLEVFQIINYKSYTMGLRVSDLIDNRDLPTSGHNIS